MMVQKYHNKKVTIDGEVFDSKKEARRWKELKLLEKAGAIQNLERQKKYQLIPSQRINGKVVERPCCYVADFVYSENGHLVVEDTKGIRTDSYKIKRKLMLEKFSIRIKET